MILICSIVMLWRLVNTGEPQSESKTFYCIKTNYMLNSSKPGSLFELKEYFIQITY